MPHHTSGLTTTTSVLLASDVSPGACQIGHGKAVYKLAGVLPDRTVLDIKRRLEPLTGVPFIRQKLVFKGILRDADLIGSTKVVEGVKVMLLGAAAAKK